MYTALPKTKEVLFDQAIQLFAQYGYENVSVRTIAQRTGIQPSSIYNHYDSKEAFLTEIYTYYVRHCSDSRVPLGRAVRHGGQRLPARGGLPGHRRPERP